MEIRQLEYFSAVAETANFTRAAELVHISQSGVSAQVRALEQELGQPLFDRAGRTVRLTETGAAILPYARAALAACAGVRHAVDELTGLARGHVSVGMVTAGGYRGLFDQLADFHRAHPGIDITLTEANSDVLVDDVRHGRLDLALVGVADPTPADLGSRVIFDEPLIAAVTADDAWSRRTTVTLRALQERDLVCLPRGTGVRTAFEDACASRRLQPRVAFEASAPDVVAGLALRGLGVAILNESMATSYGTDLHRMHITEPRLRSRLEIVWRAGGPKTAAADALAAHARAHF